MAAHRGSTVFVALPVYRGTAFVAETLRSILAQTHGDLRVIVSVDGADQESALACAPFAGDPRVRMIVQDHQLGWVDNMNWLIDACDGDLFCYWQQDDLCAPEYLERLVDALTEHPGAAVAYSDLHWFGRTDHVSVHPSMTGSAQQRILAQIEQLGWVPLRGLIPMDALRRVGHVRGLDDSITFADYLFVLRLCVAGDLVRVPRVLYRKRDHKDSASKSSSVSFHLSEREAWIRLGLELFDEARACFSERDWPRLAMVICDRLVRPRPDRWSHYDAPAVSGSEPLAVANDFYGALEARWGVPPPTGDIRPDPGLDRETGRPEPDELAAAARGVLDRHALIDMTTLGDALTLDCSAGTVAGLVLTEGWSEPEDWGTWSDGPDARLWLPLALEHGPWRVALTSRGFVGGTDPRARPRVIVSHGVRVLLDARLGDSETLAGFELLGDGADDAGTTLRIDLPDAVAPAAIGLGADQRLLSFGLERIELRRIALVDASR